MFWQWRAMPEVVWSASLPAVALILNGVSALGWILVLYSTFCIDHFDLFGVRQVVLYVRGKAYTSSGFATPLPYRLVRNPLMLGFIVAFWATPVMTQGHLLFAVVTTAYVFVAIQLEERDLLRALGDDYRRYREQTPMIIPLPRRRAPVPHSGS
jgi:protein-S-isoprenylcysteine O-methyltransferase Ste14